MSTPVVPVYQPSPEEIARQQQAMREAQERADKAAAAARAAQNQAAIDAALERARRRAGAILNEQRWAREREGSPAGRALGERLLDGLDTGAGADPGLDFTAPDGLLFSRGDRDSAPVVAESPGDRRLAGDPQVALDFIGIAPGQAPPSPVQTRTEVTVPDPRFQAPEPEDLALMFPAELVTRRWPGPRNPGPRLVNPLTEEERQRQVQAAQAEADRQVVERALAFFESDNYQDDFFDHLLELAANDPQLTAFAEGQDARENPVHEGLRRAATQAAPRVEAIRLQTIADLATAVERLRATGSLAADADPFIREGDDPDLQEKLDTARLETLRRCGQALAGLGEDCVDTLRPDTPGAAP